MAKDLIEKTKNQIKIEKLQELETEDYFIHEE